MLSLAITKQGLVKIYTYYGENILSHETYVFLIKQLSQMNLLGGMGRLGYVEWLHKAMDLACVSHLWNATQAQRDLEAKC